MTPRTGTIVWVAVLMMTLDCGGRAIMLGDGVNLPDASLESVPVDSAPCVHSPLQASEVLWIGDSWVLIPGNQHTRVRDLARSAGAIGPSDDYVIAAKSATTMSVIAAQYDAQEATATKVKVLIVTGGGWDTITGLGSDASVATAGQAFTQLLTKAASDGTVQHVIYFLYPELPSITGLAKLHPVMEQACAASAVPCHFLDLQPLWQGHAEFTAPDMIQASEAGGTILGDALWAVMTESCIGP